MKFDVLTLLNRDGELDYLPHFYDTLEAANLFSALESETDWKSEKIRIMGREVLQPRLTAWYGDATAVYTYSGLTNTPLPWTPTLLRIKEKIEETTESSFNSVLLNFYRTGADYMGWHSDDEKELGERPLIASLSLGGERRFQLRHRRDKEKIEVALSSGSLLLMGGDLQRNWVHKVAATKRAVLPRINLTFRLVHPVQKKRVPLGYPSGRKEKD